MRKLALLAIFITVISGCASLNKQAIDARTIVSLKNQTITYAVRKKPNFAAMTPATGGLGMVGALAAISAGNGIIKDNNIPDPADAIAEGLTKVLELSHGSRLVMPAVAVNEDEPAVIVSASKGKARFIIDVKTINWSFIYFPLSWSRYRVTHTVKARLIDAETRTVVAEGFCRRFPENSENAPTYDELLAKEAALLKKELSTAAEDCLKNLKKEMLSL